MSAEAGAFTMRREVVERFGALRLIAVDTIAHLREEDSGQLVVTGSHGGISSGEYAGRVPIRAVFFNDAGGGKDDAGIAALPYLQKRGIAAGTVSHDSALIGDALETWRCGIVSALNAAAEAAGFRADEPLEAALRRLYGETRP